MCQHHLDHFTCGSPPTNSFRSSSSGRVTSDVSIDSAMLYDGNYKQSENGTGVSVIYRKSPILPKVNDEISKYKSSSV